MTQSKTKPKKKAMDMDALRTECQQFHGFVAGVLEDLISRITAIWVEIEDEESPLRQFWREDVFKEVHNGLSDIASSLCNMFVPIPPVAGRPVPDPVKLCS